MVCGLRKSACKQIHSIPMFRVKFKQQKGKRLNRVSNFCHCAVCRQLFYFIFASLFSSSIRHNHMFVFCFNIYWISFCFISRFVCMLLRAYYTHNRIAQIVISFSVNDSSQPQKNNEFHSIYISRRRYVCV